MDPEKKQLIIMLGIVGVLLVVVGFLMLRPTTSNVIPSPAVGGEGSPASTSVIPAQAGIHNGVDSRFRGNDGRTNGQSPTIKPLSPEQQDAAAVTALTRSFAEFFGTYSSEGQAFQGVQLASLATQNFQDWFKAAWPKVQSSFKGKVYHSLTARALSVKLLTHDPVAGQANVEVLVQQEEVLGQIRSVQYRKLQVEALRQDGQWLVDKAVWR